jgi:hypothetical protein
MRVQAERAMLAKTRERLKHATAASARHRTARDACARRTGHMGCDQGRRRFIAESVHACEAALDALRRSALWHAR